MTKLDLEKSEFTCPTCHVPGITPMTPQCPNCRTRFRVSTNVPFDYRTEISADAIHIASRIVTNLWILLFVFPAIIGLLYSLTR